MSHGKLCNLKNDSLPLHALMDARKVVHLSLAFSSYTWYVQTFVGVLLQEVCRFCGPSSMLSALLPDIAAAMRYTRDRHIPHTLMWSNGITRT